jgi:exonuclease VII large subunit
MYEIKLKKDDYTTFDYLGSDYRALVERQSCEFCKIEMATTLNKNGEFEVWDEKWEKTSGEHDEKIEAIDEKTSELEDKLEDNPEDKKIQTAIDKLEIRKDKLEDSFQKKEEKYYDRAEKWQEKWDRKYEKSLEKKQGTSKKEESGFLGIFTLIIILAIVYFW